MLAPDPSHDSPQDVEARKSTNASSIYIRKQETPPEAFFHTYREKAAEVAAGFRPFIGSNPSLQIAIEISVASKALTRLKKWDASEGLDIHARKWGAAGQNRCSVML